jgi:hypothetical protein
MSLGQIAGHSVVEAKLYDDLKEIETRLIEGIRLAERHRLDVQAEILKEALLECQMQIDLVSQGPRPL